mgnify:CR=1 FL=1
MATAYFSVKNFDKFQHYRDRNPIWIKLYNSLLEDYAFSELPDAAKGHLLCIWLLASRSGNKLPFDPVWIARKISAKSPVNLVILADSGFIVSENEPASNVLANTQPKSFEINVASKMLAQLDKPASIEREKRESREEQRESRKDSCPEPGKSSVSRPSAAALLPLNKNGTEFSIPQEVLQELVMLYPSVDVLQQVRSMRAWLISNPEKRKTKSGVMRFVNSWLAREQNGGARYQETKSKIFNPPPKNFEEAMRNLKIPED